jgi:hypothetical protein
MISTMTKDRLILERFLKQTGNTEPDDVGEFTMALEKIALKMGNDLIKNASPQLESSPFIMGVGGDFQEFSVPLIRGIGVGLRSRVGCLWPYQSTADKSLVYFNQEYVEDAPAPSNTLIISQSLISDEHQIEAVIKRTMELKNDLPVIIVCAVSTKEAEFHIRSLFPNVLSIISSISLNADDVKLNYWELEKLWDRRELKIVRRIAKCLFDRLDASEEEKDRYPWVPQREHYGWPPAPKAVW